jgi:hypothetical protein
MKFESGQLVRFRARETGEIDGQGLFLVTKLDKDGDLHLFVVQPTETRWQGYTPRSGNAGFTYLDYASKYEPAGTKVDNEV